MSSLHLRPPSHHLPGPTPSVSSYAGDTPSTSSSEPSTFQPTPKSNGSDQGSAASSPKRISAGLYKLRTNFDQNPEELGPESQKYGGPSGEEGGEEGEEYDSEKEFRAARRHRSSFHTAYTADEERQVVKRFDRRLVIFLALLYLLSFLDRSNIGNARIAGLEDDLQLSSSQYEWLLTAFYITYILFEWMTLMYRLVPAHIYISLCVCAWGLIASFQSVVTSFWALLILRALLGISEAAFGPGVPFYLSLFYKREELALRTGLFISAAPLAASFASSLAWLIVKLSTKGPIAPWRILFLVEGFPSIVVALFAWVLIPDAPGSARFLSSHERKIATLRLQNSKINRPMSLNGTLNWRAVGETLVDPKSYITALMFFSCNVAFSSMPVFLPTIIRDMGYSSLASQALSAPPYLVAFVVVLITASLSDRDRVRSPYLIIHALLSAVAYLAIGATGHFHSYIPPTTHTLIRYVCIYPAVSGFFSAITLIITWTMDNRPSHEGKGTSIAILNTIGQFGPLIGTRLYPTSDGPWYVRGMLACSCFMVFVAVLAFMLRIFLQRENRRIPAAGIEIELEGEREGLMSHHRSIREASGPGSEVSHIL